MAQVDKTQTEKLEESIPPRSYKQQYAKELVAEFLISVGWNVFTAANTTKDLCADFMCIRGKLRPNFVNVILRNKSKVPLSQAMPENMRKQIVSTKEVTSYTTYTFFVDELCGDVYGVNGNCPPDFIRGKYKTEAFWELKTMKLMFKLDEEKRKILRSLS